jgi:HSP20 family molecular chaperone IbpA
MSWEDAIPRVPGEKSRLGRGTMMSQISVTKVKETKSPHFVNEVENLADRIRQRAYQLFLRRGEAEGSPVEDWLKAERELIWAPESDLVEKNGRYELQIAVPGFTAKDMCVTARANALTIRAESSHSHQEKDEHVHFCEFSDRMLFRTFEMPAPIDADKLSARLDNGIRHISAAKRNLPRRL